MKNINDINLFSDDQQFQSQKQKSIDNLIKDRNILAVLSKYNLTREDIEDNWIDFLDYQEDLNTCNGCTSINNCPKVSKGMQRVFNYQNNVITLSLSPCKYGDEILENQKILSNILLKNVSDKILLTKANDVISIASNEGSNAGSIIKKISEYVKDSSHKGYYLYGKGGTGKSTLMGLLIRNLAKQGYKCGFIHFPTFLMDLKNSFGEDGNDGSIELMKNLDFLVIDDVGGESVTNWSRDEVLSSIIAYRLQNNKATFFTSEYPVDKLKGIYTLRTGDKLRVERLIDRMKAVSISLELVGKDLR